MPTAVEIKWLGKTTGFSVNTSYQLSSDVRDARIPLHSVSDVLINWGDKPVNAKDNWELTGPQFIGGRSARTSLSSLHSLQLSEILVILKRYMGSHGRITVSGLTVSAKEAAHFSSIAGVPVIFTSSSFKDAWPGAGTAASAFN